MATHRPFRYSRYGKELSTDTLQIRLLTLTKRNAFTKPSNLVSRLSLMPRTRLLENLKTWYLIENENDVHSVKNHK